MLRNTCHGPRTSLPQRSGHSTNHVQQNITPNRPTRHRLRKERGGRGTTTSRTTTRASNELSPPKSACSGASGKGAVFQHACYRCQHACSSSQHAILQKSHVNMVAEFSTASRNSNMAFQNSNVAFQNFNMAFQNSKHGVSKLRTWCFTRCRARTSNDAVEGKGVDQWLLRLTPVYLRPQKQITPRPPPSPRLRSASFTTNVLGVPCVATHTRQRQDTRALRGSVCRKELASDACDSPARVARRPSTQTTRC